MSSHSHFSPIIVITDDNLVEHPFVQAENFKNSQDIDFLFGIDSKKHNKPLDPDISLLMDKSGSSTGSGSTKPKPKPSAGSSKPKPSSGSSSSKAKVHNSGGKLREPQSSKEASITKRT